MTAENYDTFFASQIFHIPYKILFYKKLLNFVET